MNSLPDEWITRLFERFDELYGEEWSQLVPTEGRRGLLKIEWGSTLWGCSGHDIKHGLEAARSLKRDRVPGFDKPMGAYNFYNLCKGKKATVILSDEDFPFHKISLEAADLHIAKIREVLSKARIKNNIRT